jgi:hypothetical protein
VLRGGKTISVTNKNQLFGKIPELVQAMVNEIAGGTTPIQTYKIGDTGPAGGIVFYDKGAFSDGWRYLEAAPVGTDFTAEWGAFMKGVYGTRTAVGSGKRNTQLIVDYLQRFGEINGAAQVCSTLDINGYKDWFLPSKDELDLIYKNLAQKGLGGFNSGFYWSSSRTNGHNAWYQFFSNGIQDYAAELNPVSVRAIRAF